MTDYLIFPIFWGQPYVPNPPPLWVNRQPFVPQQLTDALTEVSNSGYFHALSQYGVGQVRINAPLLQSQPLPPTGDPAFVSEYTDDDSINFIKKAFNLGLPSPVQVGAGTVKPIYIVMPPNGAMHMSGGVPDWATLAAHPAPFQWQSPSGPINIIWAWVPAQSNLSDTMRVITHEIVEALGADGSAPKELCDDCKIANPSGARGAGGFTVETYFNAVHNDCVAPPFFPPGTEFVITSASSGLVLDVPAFSMEPGARIQQSTGNEGANELWTLNYPEGATGYEIVSVNSGLVLDVPAFSKLPGTQIQQWIENGGVNQLWTIRGKAPNAYEIVSVNSGLVLDVPAFSKQPGAQIQQWTENGGGNQLWTFAALGGFPSVSIVGGSNNTGANITITGQGFSPGTGFYIHYMGVPGNQPGVLPGEFVPVGGDGKFSLTDPISFTSGNPDDALGYVTIMLQTVEGRVLAIGSVSASYWVTNDPCWPIRRKIANLEDQLTDPNPPGVVRALEAEIRLQERALKACEQGQR